MIILIRHPHLVVRGHCGAEAVRVVFAGFSPPKYGFHPIPQGPSGSLL